MAQLQYTDSSGTYRLKLDALRQSQCDLSESLLLTSAAQLYRVAKQLESVSGSAGASAAAVFSKCSLLLGNECRQ